MKKCRIEKILSHNAIIARDSNNNEFIALGTGIGFGKRQGAEIDPVLFEKVFTTNSVDLYKKLFVTLSKMSPLYITFVDQTVKYAKEDLGRDLNESIYVLLADHLNFAIERLQQNIILPCPMLTEIQLLYKDEYNVAKKVVTYIEENMNIKLPDSEIGFIALHIINASSSSSDVNEVLNTMLVINEIISLIENFFQFKFNTDNLDYLRLLTHLNFFARRMKMNRVINDDDEIKELFKGRHPQSQLCVERISDYLKSEYNYVITDSEKTYLCIHISRCINSMNQA